MVEFDHFTLSCFEISIWHLHFQHGQKLPILILFELSLLFQFAFVTTLLSASCPSSYLLIIYLSPKLLPYSCYINSYPIFVLNFSKQLPIIYLTRQSEGECTSPVPAKFITIYKNSRPKLYPREGRLFFMIFHIENCHNQ